MSTSSISTPTPSFSLVPPTATGTRDSDPFDGPVWSTPIAWVLIPVLIIGILGASCTIFCLRRRRNRNRAATTPGDVERANARGTGTRRRGWGGETTRPDEGLDENGEAPPAYALKALPGRSLATGGAPRGDLSGQVRDSTSDADTVIGDEADRNRMSGAGSPIPPTAEPVSPVSSGPMSPVSPQGTQLPPAFSFPPDYNAAVSSNDRSSAQRSNGDSPAPPLITTPEPAFRLFSRR